MIIYGIPNCDTCRKARKWLDAHHVEHTFHDLRNDGLDGEMLDRWLNSLQWEKLLNTRSTTWRGLPESQRTDLTLERARALIIEHPTLVKRPVVENGKTIEIGFSAKRYGELFT